ncbi:MAG: FtsX-like permease family protein [Lentisphaeria bacterium]|nr:FtsX-like permease family protein [Lentisphaeria bacterium]
MDTDMETVRAGVPAYFRVSTWQEENRQLLGVLQVEKRMMFSLLIFIVLVAAFSIANTLITSVYQKTHEIGILKALGASDGIVLRIFVFQGMLVGMAGDFCGTVAGILVIHFRNDLLRLVTQWTGQDLFPKEFYYFNELPAHIIAGDVVLIAVMAVVLCTLGAVIPAVRAAKLDPAGALRYE